MERILPTALVMGVIIGLVVAAYMNIFNVPVIEWAIDLEGKAAANGEEDESQLPLSALTGLGGQRVGMTLGLAVVGVLFGAVFSGLYHLMRWATPGWSPWAWGAIAGFLGFWAVSMYTQIKFPLNPPGVGDESTLLARQGFQFLFIFVSTASVALVIYGAGLVNRNASGGARWFRFTAVGHLLLWMGIALATVGYRRYQERNIHAFRNSAAATS
ncbi:hypothetical protein GBAR_LOCUS27111 [Geodia barretti]|uniref:Uncharacterized protein n=1 Tax=Geodia barretti TaxID=519541 RepID=A0AA35TLM0_GEOBA|nr:hypothetical protein GBAR_LOCUS27111 [Geodia barretti]